MADKKLTDVASTSIAQSTDSVIIVQESAIRKIALSNLSFDSGEVIPLELRKYDGYIQWRKADSQTWNNLYSMEDVKGETGASPTFQVGEVKTIENGQPASVTISGTKENVILNFSIPKGLNGTGAGDVTTDQLNSAIQSLKIPKSLSELLTDETHRTVTDSEKTIWNNKSSLTEQRVNELIDLKLPKSAEEVQY